MPLFQVGFVLFPDLTFASCPPLDLICVPGGAKGVAAAMTDGATIDFVRRQSAAIAGETVAQAIGLGLEYDPAPPFACGDPERAPEAVKRQLADRYAAPRAAFRRSIEQAAVL